jgi:hypothetical protein
MAKKQYARSPEFKGPDMTISFAQNLFKVRENTGKFGCTFIGPNSLKTAKVCAIPDGNGGWVKKSLEEIVAGVIFEEWGQKGLERAKNGLIKSPFLDGTGKEARNKETGELHPGMGEGKFFIRCTANADRQPIVSSTVTAVVPATQEDVYSGCVGFPTLNVFAWHNDENGDGVSFGINKFFKREDGERLGGSGGSSPDAWTETVEDHGGAPDETKSGAGASGLFG